MKEDCLKCPEFNPCAKDGQWCFIGALVADSENTKACAELTMPNTADMVAPIMRDMTTVNIPIGNGQSVAVLKEDIAKAIKSEIYKSVREEYLKR
jgi:hypothetical protein